VQYFIVPLVNVCVSSEGKHTLLAGIWSIALGVRTGSNCVAGNWRIRLLQKDKLVSDYEDDDNDLKYGDDTVDRGRLGLWYWW